MEEILLRFPMLGREIFKKIDNKTLVECRQIDETWMEFIDNEKFKWTRVIQKYLNLQDSNIKWSNTLSVHLPLQPDNLKKSWQKAIRRSNTEEVSKLAHSFYKFQKVRQSKTKSPFLIAAL